jgi:hypothetical protein
MTRCPVGFAAAMLVANIVLTLRLAAIVLKA